MVKPIYVPAIGIQFMNYWHYKNITVNGKYDIKHFTDKSMFKYDYGLISAFYGMQHNVSDLRKHIGWPKDKLMILDSGGFEASTQNIPINPIKLLRWMEDNGDIIMNLDIPYNQKETGVPTEKEFAESLKASSENFALFEKERKNYKAKFYNILHGETWDHMNRWYNEVKKYKFDGWASGLKPSGDIIQQVLGFSFLYEKGELKDAYGLHFFGMSGNRVTPIIAYIAHKYLDNLVTFDSSTYNLGAVYRTYFIPLKTTVSDCLFMGRKHKETNPWLTELPCNCPVCENTSIKELTGDMDHAGTLVSLHNLWNTIQFNKGINAYIDNLPRLEQFLIQAMGKRGTKEVMDCIKFVDYCVENGTKKGFEMKKAHFMNNPQKQMGLSAYK